jgi:hypothetical protein
MSTLTAWKHPNFMVFRTAREADTKVAEEGWDNEGGRSSPTGCRIVQTPDSALRYKVVLAQAGEACTEHAFASIRECEAFIRCNTPAPPERSIPATLSRLPFLRYCHD